MVNYWSDRQGAVVSERLDHVKFRKGTRFWEGEQLETKAADPLYALNLTEWSQELTQAIMGTLRREVRRMIRGEARDLESRGMFVVIPDVEAFVDEVTRATEKMVRNAAANQSQRVIDRIIELDQEDASLSSIKREVRRMTSKRGQWAQQLSIVAVTNAMEETRAGLHLNVDGPDGEQVLFTKTWNAEQDERTRQAHREVDGETVDAGTTFLVGGHPMICPGDSRAPIHLVANCRCWLTFEIKEIW